MVEYEDCLLEMSFAIGYSPLFLLGRRRHCCGEILTAVCVTGCCWQQKRRTNLQFRGSRDMELEPGQRDAAARRR